MVFTRLNTGEAQLDWESLLSHCLEGTSLAEVQTFYGCAVNLNFRRRAGDQEANHVCWRAYEFNTIWGCSHGCQYCGVGRGASRLAIGANVEDYAEKVARRALEESPLAEVLAAHRCSRRRDHLRA